MHDGDLHALGAQTIGRFQPQQSAADDDRPGMLSRRLQHGIDVVQVAERDDSGQVVSGHRKHDGLRAGRQQQAVVGSLDTGLGSDSAPHAIDADDRVAAVQSDAMFAVPGRRMQHDLLDPLLPGEQRREQNAIVVAVRFGAEHLDVVAVGCDLQQFFDGTHAGHAVTDHHQPPLGAAAPAAADLCLHPHAPVGDAHRIGVDRVVRLLQAAAGGETEMMLVYGRCDDDFAA